jgi:hypothetical protein
MIDMKRWFLLRFALLVCGAVGEMDLWHRLASSLFDRHLFYGIFDTRTLLGYS